VGVENKGESFFYRRGRRKTVPTTSKGEAIKAFFFWGGREGFYLKGGETIFLESLIKRKRKALTLCTGEGLEKSDDIPGGGAPPIEGVESRVEASFLP